MDFIAGCPWISVNPQLSGVSQWHKSEIKSYKDDTSMGVIGRFREISANATFTFVPAVFYKSFP